jgi:excisionase family DNA binding protein
MAYSKTGRPLSLEAAGLNRHAKQAEVAEVLGLHRGSIYRKIQSGELPAIRLGEDGPLRIRSDQLDEWLAANAVPRGERR